MKDRAAELAALKREPDYEGVLQGVLLEPLTQRCFDRIRANAQIQIRGRATFTYHLTFATLTDAVLEMHQQYRDMQQQCRQLASKVAA